MKKLSVFLMLIFISMMTYAQSNDQKLRFLGAKTKIAILIPIQSYKFYYNDTSQDRMVAGISDKFRNYIFGELQNKEIGIWTFFYPYSTLYEPDGGRWFYIIWNKEQQSSFVLKEEKMNHIITESDEWWWLFWYPIIV